MKITKDVLDAMVAMRKKGVSYKNIGEKLGVSKWSCTQYLRNIEVDRSAIEIEWRQAEEEAASVLTKNGFTNLINLNTISPSPYWDYYAERLGNRYLIDVTINQHKNLVDKSLRTVDGFKHVVLLRESPDHWKFLEITLKEIF
jgi:hypothetical protein